MRSSSRWARVAWTGLAALAVLACTSNDDDAGVAVTVSLSGARWTGAGTPPFDHIFLEATGGGKRGAVCLLPVSGSLREVDVSSTPATVRDPCIDLDPNGWVEVPSLDTWDLERRPRTANFVFPAGVHVDVRATARFGGGVHDVAVATGSAEATLHYPAVALELAPTAATACEAKVVGSLPAGSETATEIACNTDLVACISDTSARARTQGLKCGTRVALSNTPAESTCTTPADATTVFTSGPLAVGPCASYYVTGHFARCKPGDTRPITECDLTADCVPPSTSATFQWGTRNPITQTVDFSCVPPFAFPVRIELLAAPRAIAGFLALAQAASTASDRCSFIVTSVAKSPTRC